MTATQELAFSFPVHGFYPEPLSAGWVENLHKCDVSASIGIPPFLLITFYHGFLSLQL
jgi:hypothetical protein